MVMWLQSIWCDRYRADESRYGTKWYEHGYVKQFEVVTDTTSKCISAVDTEAKRRYVKRSSLQFTEEKRMCMRSQNSVAQGLTLSCLPSGSTSIKLVFTACTKTCWRYLILVRFWHHRCCWNLNYSGVIENRLCNGQTEWQRLYLNSLWTAAEGAGLRANDVDDYDGDDGDVDIIILRRRRSNKLRQ